MKWEGGRRSSNVEDRRGMGGRPAFVGGGIGTIVLILVALYFGVDPSFLLQNLPDGAGPSASQSTNQSTNQAPAADGTPDQPDPASDFVSVVLADTEDTWTALFAEGGARYEVPKLVLFSGSVQSACGSAQAAMGPFYCPADRKVYIDLSFYQDLRDR
ncbi:MAG: neutral zinc metallopeptidase, partial [Gammaproteobacteria bacterium]